MCSKTKQHARSYCSESAFAEASSLSSTVLIKGVPHQYLIYASHQTIIAGATCCLLHEPVIKTGAENVELHNSKMGMCIHSSKEIQPQTNSLKAPPHISPGWCWLSVWQCVKGTLCFCTSTLKYKVSWRCYHQYHCYFIGQEISVQ